MTIYMWGIDMSPDEGRKVVEKLGDQMHKMHIDLSNQITEVKTKVEDDRSRRDEQDARIDALESKYHRLLVGTITLMLAGIINVLIALAQGNGSPA
jgi:hypothetical protein